MKELTYEYLSKFKEIDENLFSDDFNINKIMFGQKDAENSLKLGLSIKEKGYNIFLYGLSGCGKTSLCKEIGNEIAKNERVPDDLCYVYNFKDSKKPLLINLKAGDGKIFKNDIDDFVEDVTETLKKITDLKDYKDSKDKTAKDYESKKDELLNEIKYRAKELNFIARLTEQNVYFIPLNDNKEPIDDDDFENLDEETQNKVNENTKKLQKISNEIINKIKTIEKEYKNQISEIVYNIAMFIVGDKISNLQDKYKENKKITEYLSNLKEDILSNLSDFMQDDSIDEEQIIPWVKAEPTDHKNKYQVNLYVDNSKLEYAPVIVSYHPSYNNLVGEIEYDNENGNLITDYTKIKSGLLQKANGGYLILQASDVLNYYTWELIKRVLKTNEIVVEPYKDLQFSSLTISTIEPKKIDANLKIILVGDYESFNIFSSYDDDFNKLFKITIPIEYEIEKNENNLKESIKFIKNIEEKNNSYKITNSGIKELLIYSIRYTENINYLTTKLSKLADIIAEANAWAKIENKIEIDDVLIKRAITEIIKRSSMYERKTNEMILNNKIIINTEGSKIGEINGLYVYDVNNFTFGHPVKISATSYCGKAGFVSIERECEISGNIHDKSSEIIIGFLGERYAQDFPLSLSSRICFEQNYNGIDGDSASIAEIYAILSSLSEVPINQEIAVTGSVNQKGDVQAIGAVSHKISGFYKLCKERGLTGNQGVIIPYDNIDELVLSDEVLEAVKENKFHIYPIKKVDEGIEIIMGCEAGNKTSKGKYKQGSVNYKVYKKLKKYYEITENE